MNFKKPKITRTFVIIFGILILLAVPISITGFTIVSQEKVCHENKCFNVEIADDDFERAKGLMFVRNLEKDRGMLFIFNKSAKHSFWMKNTKIPLDIIWMNSQKEIIYVKHNAQPCDSDVLCETFAPDKDAKYVLEINAGLSKRFGINETGKMSFINIEDKTQ